MTCLVALCVATPFMPPPSGVASGAIQGLLAHGVIAALALWLAREHRSLRGALHPPAADGEAARRRVQSWQSAP